MLKNESIKIHEYLTLQIGRLLLKKIGLDEINICKYKIYKIYCHVQKRQEFFKSLKTIFKNIFLQ